MDTVPNNPSPVSRDFVADRYKRKVQKTETFKRLGQVQKVVGLTLEPLDRRLLSEAV